MNAKLFEIIHEVYLQKNAVCLYKEKEEIEPFRLYIKIYIFCRLRQTTNKLNESN